MALQTSHLLDPNIKNKLATIYYNPKNPASFGSVKKLAKAASVNIQIVKDFLSGEQAYRQLKPRRIQGYATSKHEVFGIDSQWSTDLLDFSIWAPENDGYKFILIVIDIFSKYVFVEPIYSKSAKDVTSAMQAIFIKSGRNPMFLNSDNGLEYQNSSFKNLCKEYGIIAFTSYGELKV